MAVYNPSGSGNVHTDRVMSGGKKMAKATPKKMPMKKMPHESAEMMAPKKAGKKAVAKKAAPKKAQGGY